MKRRDVLKSTAIVLGYSLVGGSALAVINGCQADTSPMWEPSWLSKSEWRLLQEVTNRIIPETDTPGAKAAFVDRYIDEAVHNNFTTTEQEHFRSSLGKFDEASEKRYAKYFVDLDPKEMDEILQGLSDEADASRESTDESHVFDMVKELTITGYFTSEVGVTQALVYDPVPGPYKGCIDLNDVGGTYAY